MSPSVRHSPTHAATAATAATAARAILGLSCVAMALSGCGGGRVVDPSLAAVARPTGFIEASYPSGGVQLSIPRNWTATTERPPLVAVISSGTAVISLWRYPGKHAALTGTSQLQGALTALLAAIRAQQPHLQVDATGFSRVGGDGAVIIDATERVNGKLRRVRTEHVYLDDGELVLDAYAPVSEFPSVDHAVFSPVRKSLALIDGGVPSGRAASTSTTATPSPASGG